MIGKTFISQQNLADKNQKARHGRMQRLYQYDLQEPYFSFNGKIACLSTKGISKWLITIPSLKLTIITAYKLVMMLVAGIYALVKSLFKGYPFVDFKDYYFFFFKRADTRYLNNFSQDACFGLQRVSGADPTWIKDFPSQFKTIDEVVETIGNIIFITTAQHNCVHYSLYQQVAFAPNMPFSLMSAPDTDLNTPLSQEYLSQLMPPLKNVLVQSLGFYLNYIQTKKIGDYKLGQFDLQARGIIRDYQQKLGEISQEIELRNQKRDAQSAELSWRYDLMNPQHMANSITS